MNKTIATLLTTIALLPSVGHTAEVQSFIVTKGQQLQQTNASIPVLDNTDNPHRFFSSVDGSTSNSILGVSLKLPNATTKTFTNDGGFMFQQGFTNKTLLDAAYGAGTYAFTIQTMLDGTNKPTLKLPADAYPTTPHIANWKDAQAIEASLPFTLYWDPFVGGTTNDFVQFHVEDNAGQSVASSPDLLHPNAINGTNGSATIPANFLAENQTYNAHLLFVKRTSIDTTNIPGATGTAGYYRETKFPLATLPAASAGGRVQFSASTFADSETSSNSQVVTVTRTGSDVPTSVLVTMTDGTATSGLDYLNVPTTVNFAEGATSAVVSIAILDDYILESNETVNLSLSTPTLGELGPRSNAVFTIVDNELASAGKIQFTTKGFSFAESSGSAKVTLTRFGGSTGAVSATYHTVGGTATSGVDFIPTNGTVNFANGQSTATIVVPLIGDALDETNEFFWVILDSTAGGAAFGTNLEATVTITDDDTAGVIAFKSATYSVNENIPSALITVTRVGGAAGNATVDFATADGSATAGLDYYPTNGTLTFGSNELTKTFSVAITNDFEVESNETVLLHLTNPGGGAKLGALSNATLHIIDEESSFSFTNATYTVGEAGGSISINVLRTGTLITTSAVSFATADVTATSTNDYRGTNGTLVFPANIKFKTLVIPIVNDTLVESNESFTLTLSNSLNGAQLGELHVTTVIITNNDFGGVIFFPTNSYSVNEKGTNATITLSRTNGLASAVSVDFTTSDGSAQAGVDYSNATQVITFAAGETSKKILVPVINDTIDETNKTVLLALSNPQGGGSLGARTNATLTIVNDDSGGVIAFKSATYITNENDGAFSVTVVRTNGLASGVTVDFTTQNGTAIAGDDYFPTNGTLVFAAGETNKTISIVITNDTLPEGNETLTLLLSNPTGGATLGTISNATLTIRDDESSVAFSEASYVVNEGGTNATLTVIRSGALITPVTVQFSTVDGSAVSPDDYHGTNGTLTFPTNVSSQVIKIPIVNDTIVEGPETFGVFLHTPTDGLQLGAQTNAVVTITDNDSGGVIFFSTNSYSANENGTNAVITLSRTNGLASGVSVQFITENGSAEAGSDYSNATQVVVFAAGETSKKVLVPIINDTLDETNETVHLVLVDPQGGATLGARVDAELTIVDDDSGGVIAFKSATYITNENDGAFSVTVVRTNGLASGVTVDFTTQNGTAIAGDDYTATNGTLVFAAGETNKTISIVITNDTLPEGNETLTLLLSNPTGGATLGAISNATLTIRDDESSVAFSEASYVVNEGGTNATLTVIRSGALITPVTVQFSTTDGSAVSPDDYHVTNGTLTFPTNVSSQIIKIPIVNDTIVEGPETFGVFLHTPTDGLQLGAQTNAVVTITDNDSGGVIFFSTNRYSVNENGTNAIITLSRTNGLASGVSVQFTSENGSAEAGSDYSNATQIVTFAAGETSKKILVPIINDTLDETNETVHLALADPQGGATLGARVEAELTILDDDTAGVISFKTAAQSANENATNFVVMVIRTGGLASGVTVDYRTQDGTASHNSDYAEAHDTLVFGAGETNKTFSVFITNDVVAEGNETLSVFLSNPTGGATLGAITNDTLTIVDDESSISISNATTTVSESGTNVVITLTRSGALLTAVSVDFATIDGTAISTNDYRGTNGTVIFPANTAVKTITIPIVNDTIVENNETFSFAIFNPQGGVQLGTTTNETVTIVNDDLAGTVQFAASTFNGTEGSNAIITITRTGGLASGQSVNFVMSGGTAVSGVDYTNKSGTITFGAGETNKTVLVPLVLDGAAEPAETVTLLLNSPVGGVTIGAISVATLTITDKPDPNAVPLTGPDFLSGKFGTTSFTASTVNGALFAGNSINIVATGTSTASLLTLDPTPFAVGTIQMDNSGSGGVVTFSTGTTSFHSYAVADGSASVGSSGTFIFDGIDTVNKVTSGRFTLHMRETTDGVAPNGPFVDVTGSFRTHYH